MLQEDDPDLTIQLIARKSILVEEDYSHHAPPQPDSDELVLIDRETSLPLNRPQFTDFAHNAQFDSKILATTFTHDTERRMAVLEFANHYVMDNAYVATGTAVYSLLKKSWQILFMVRIPK